MDLGPKSKGIWTVTRFLSRFLLDSLITGLMNISRTDPNFLSKAWRWPRNTWEKKISSESMSKEKGFYVSALVTFLELFPKNREQCMALWNYLVNCQENNSHPPTDYGPLLNAKKYNPNMGTPRNFYKRGFR